MLSGELKYIEDRRGVIVFPITKLNAVMDDTGKTLEEILQYLGNKGGIIVRGEVDEVSDLPTTAEHNDAYFVGDDIYIYIDPGRGDVGTPNNAWLNKGPLRGPEGPKGDIGDPAGFGTLSASVVNPLELGTPSVTLDSSGPNSAKNMEFIFRNIRGEVGPQGETGPMPPTVNNLNNEISEGTTAPSTYALSSAQGPEIKTRFNGVNARIDGAVFVGATLESWDDNNESNIDE